MMQSQDDTSVVMKGQDGRKLRRLPLHVSMHVENEASGDTFLRHRANTGDASTLSKPSSGFPDTSDKEYFKDDLMTPTNQRLGTGSDDSGYLSPMIRNSDTDPDWYLRPSKKLNTDTHPKKTYKSTKPSVLTQTRRMFLSNSRPNFVDSRSTRRWHLTTEAVLGGLLIAILVASIGFTALCVRLYESKQIDLNGKSIEFARQQRNSKNLEGKKNLDQINEIKSKDFPQEPRDGQLVNYEQEALPTLQTEEASRKIVQEELIKTPEGEGLNAPVSVEAVGGSGAVKKQKRRSKNKNPLTKSIKKDKMSVVKKPGDIALDYDKDPSSFRGRLEPRDLENSQANDYDDDPPSTFRGKQDLKEQEMQDNIDNDYEQDPSTFRGKPKMKFNDYDSDPSTFRGKQEADQGYPEVVDLMTNIDK